MKVLQLDARFCVSQGQSMATMRAKDDLYCSEVASLMLSGNPSLNREYTSRPLAERDAYRVAYAEYLYATQS